MGTDWAWEQARTSECGRSAGPNVFICIILVLCSITSLSGTTLAYIASVPLDDLKIKDYNPGDVPFFTDLGHPSFAGKCLLTTALDLGPGDATIK